MNDEVRVDIANCPLPRSRFVLARRRAARAIAMPVNIAYASVNQTKVPGFGCFTYFFGRQHLNERQRNGVNYYVVKESERHSTKRTFGRSSTKRTLQLTGHCAPGYVEKPFRRLRMFEHMTFQKNYSSFNERNDKPGQTDRRRARQQRVAPRLRQRPKTNNNTTIMHSELFL